MLLLFAALYLYISFLFLYIHTHITVTLENRRMNLIKWAPQGGRCMIAFIEPGRTGQLEFVDVGAYWQNQETVQADHPNCREIHWDPSGRYLVSAATQTLSSAPGDDTGYIIWSYQGQQLYRENIRHFYQFLWRPRPKSLLDQKDIQRGRSKEFRTYRKIFEDCDREMLLAESGEKIRKNQKKLDMWRKRYSRNNEMKEYKKSIFERQKELRQHYNIDEKKEYERNVIEEEINVAFENHIVSKETLNMIINNEKVDFDNLDDDGNVRNSRGGSGSGGGGYGGYGPGSRGYGNSNNNNSNRYNDEGSYGYGGNNNNNNNQPGAWGRR